MSAAATLTRPPGGEHKTMDVRDVQRHVRRLRKREAVQYLMAHAGVTRAWSERHLKALGEMHPHQFAQTLAEAGCPVWRIYGFDPTGNNAARNVDMERAGVIAQ